MSERAPVAGPMHILVTGGAGLVGATTAAGLLYAGDRVTIVDAWRVTA